MRFIALSLCVLFLINASSNTDKLSSDNVMTRARTAVAQTKGEIRLAGLKKPVEIFRDPWGVPHIFAQNADDLFFAQGFVAAQDRLWQMEMWRRAAEGTLSEILGPTAIERDKFARLIRYRGDMDQEYKSYSPDSKQIINSFVQGVNAFIQSTTDNPPIEFQLMGFKPKPWTPEVCLTRLAGFSMTRNMTTEVARAQLVKAVGPEVAAKLQDLEPPIAIEVPEGLDLNGIDRRISAGAETALTAPNLRANDGSNNWVVSGALTATGKPILANDPHRTIALPSLRYMAHLVAPGWNVIGAGEPALPGIAVGHNERIGFGFTIVGIDQQDVYVEATNPENPLEYKDGSTWRAMEVEEQQLVIKGKDQPMPLELHFTKHGPVVFEDQSRHRAYVLKWVGAEPGTAGYLPSLTLDRAHNWNEFETAMDKWKVPSENLVYADTDGNIGWHAAGLSPVRKGWSGLLPVPGNSGKYEWQGFLPMSELPHSYNPASHFIATANNNILPSNYKYQIGYEWSPPVRAIRISEVLRSREGFTVDDFEILQHDVFSLPARDLVPLLHNLKSSDPDVMAALKLLNNWDLRLTVDSAASALFEIWLNKLNPAVMRPRIPKEAAAVIGTRGSLFKVIDILKNPDKDFGSDPVAGRDAMLVDTLKQAMTEIKQRLGDDSSKWQWGALHQAPFKHPLSGGTVVGGVFDLDSVPRGGDGNTVNATAGAGFAQTHGASFREILDLSDWDKSVAINVPGQSGQPGSQHYGDLLPLWAKGQYFPLLYSRKAIEAQSKEKLVLLPK